MSSETVLRRIRAGELPAVRLASNAIRISEAALEDFLARAAYHPSSNQATSIRKENP